ncbi:pimeloyl-ACP methyl ester carboxylesterase [Arthrobacter nitrophenolicus]|uniref:Pimeloyl-ACP methyl ester carboxylesterase n=1 Tax=Arthrobacter nitrophenolicus TaxID=683150 RepID=A0ACC6TL97_9MICC
MKVTDVGEGPAILLIHGLACNTSDWFTQIAYFRRTHRVIALDLRGHGRSSVPTEGYGTASFVADFISVLDALGVSSVVAVGHSLGGLLAKALAITHPERVSAVVAIDPSGGLPDAQNVYKSLAPLVAQPGGLASIFERSESQLTPPHSREAHQYGALVTDISVLTKVWHECLVAPGVLMSDTEALRQRRAPLLVLHGKAQVGAVERDQEIFVHPADHSLELPVGHWIHHDLPELTHEIITQWLSKLDD